MLVVVFMVSDVFGLDLNGVPRRGYISPLGEFNAQCHGPWYNKTTDDTVSERGCGIKASGVSELGIRHRAIHICSKRFEIVR